MVGGRGGCKYSRVHLRQYIGYTNVMAIDYKKKYLHCLQQCRHAILLNIPQSNLNTRTGKPATNAVYTSVVTRLYRFCTIDKPVNLASGSCKLINFLTFLWIKALKPLCKYNCPCLGILPQSLASRYPTSNSYWLWQWNFHSVPYCSKWTQL